MRLIFAALLFLAAPPAHAEGQPATTPAGIMDRLLGPTPLVDDLRHLTDAIGGRPTGSPAYARAVEWTAARLREAGLEVRTEEFRSPHLWIPGREQAELVEGVPAWAAPRARSLRVAAMPFTQATPDGGLEADVVDVQDATDLPLKMAAERVRGRIALVHTAQMKDLAGLFAEYTETPRILARLRELGAAGVLWMSNRPGRLLYRHNATLNGSLYGLPAAVVERDGALWMARRMAAGERIRVKLDLASTVHVDAPAHNVVAVLRGRELPEETVVLGAHLDSWDLGRGALDNACNVALVIDAARQLAALPAKPRRTVRFVLFGGEEAGLFGSLGDVRAHEGELDRLRAMITFDIGTGRTTGFSLGGREDLRPAVEAALAPAQGLGPFENTADAFIGTDNFDYLLQGVPNLVANQEAGPYLADYHAESDTFDKVDVVQLKKNAALAALVTWQLAQAKDPAAPRQSRAEVEALLEQTGAADQMRTFGLWEGFEGGRRGRSRPARPTGDTVAAR